jgi:hypothetical protein
MAILWVRVKPGAEVSVGQDGRRTFRRGYYVRSSITNETRTAILNCGLVPVYGAPHPEDLTATCSAVNPAQHKDHPYLWDVTAEWTTGGGGDPERHKPPDERRPKWSYRFQPLRMAFPRDLDGKLFADSSGTPFDPPPDMPIFVDEVTVTRFEATINRTADRAFLNATNTDAWNGAAAGEALCADISADEVWEGGQYWKQKTYKILVSPKIVVSGTNIGGWDPEYVLDAGPKVLVDGKPEPIVENGFYDARAVPLDGHGERLGRSGGVLLPAVYLQFRTKKKTAFAPLNLVPPS